MGGNGPGRWDPASEARMRALWQIAALIGLPAVALLVLKFDSPADFAANVRIVAGIFVDRVPQRFDEELWKASTENWKDPVRLRMVRDLRRRHPLVGLHRDAVVDLLGPPADGAPFRPGAFRDDPDAPEAMIWHLGPDGLHIDSMWLVVVLDRDERVVRTRVVND